jgi:drug/metabolite transporter superfamily protein YnfA
MKIIPLLQTLKQQMFVVCQEGAQEEVYRAFGVLKAHFHILASLGRSFHHYVCGVIMCACIIMYNMIIKDECEESYDMLGYKIIKSSVATLTITSKELMDFVAILLKGK